FPSESRRRVSVGSVGSQDLGAHEFGKVRSFAAAWGNGDFGRLGLGNLESQFRPKFLNPSFFGNQSLKEIACGGAHTLFLTVNGDVYATGLNDFGQLGISDSQSYSAEPKRVSGIPKEIIKIAAGYHHSAAVTVDGEVYTWGKNSNGQLGLGKNAGKVISFPNKVGSLDGVVIKTISLGSEHSVAITDKGETLSWGGGESGRLGHGHESSFLGFQKTSSEFTPRLIRGLDGVTVMSVSAGMMHTACISENGSVYFFGERELSKWGFGKAETETTPSAIRPLPSSEEVSCGGYHTCVVTNGGELYTWGTNENGCLGTGCTDISYSPERVQGPFSTHPVSKVACGWKHTAAIAGNKVYAWGWGGSNGTFREDGYSPGGQLGQGDDVDYTEPVSVEVHGDVKPLQISCGFNHTAAIFQ
ncbi:hypothetical protein M569_03859, partial [Genlisea aurea]